MIPIRDIQPSRQPTSKDEEVTGIGTLIESSRTNDIVVDIDVLKEASHESKAEARGEGQFAEIEYWAMFHIPVDYSYTCFRFRARSSMIRLLGFILGDLLKSSFGKPGRMALKI